MPALRFYLLSIGGIGICVCQQQQQQQNYLWSFFYYFACQALKILGEKLTEISLNRDTVSEVLRCFLIAYGGDGSLCDSLRTKPFQALPPDKKAATLAFLVNELNSSTLIIK